MTQTYAFREDWNCVLMHSSGDFVAQEYRDMVAAVKADERVKPGHLRLSDVRAVPMLPTPEFTRTVAGIMSELEAAKPSSRVAILVKGDVQFGMLRLYQGHVEDAYDRIGVFRDLEDALKWLQLPADVPDPFEPDVWRPDWNSAEG